MTSCAMTTTLDESIGSMRTGNFAATGMSTPSCSYLILATSFCSARKFCESSWTRCCAARSCARSRLMASLPLAPSWPSFSSLTTARRLATSCSERERAETALRMAELACSSIICDEDVFARSASCADLIALSKSSLRTWVHVGGRKGQIVSAGVVLVVDGAN